MYAAASHISLKSVTSNAPVDQSSTLHTVPNILYEHTDPYPDLALAKFVRNGYFGFDMDGS
jgi:hypothetical protein